MKKVWNNNVQITYVNMCSTEMPLCVKLKIFTPNISTAIDISLKKFTDKC